MAYTTSNNQNNNQPMTNTYTPIVFSNPDSKLFQSQFSISYFNRVMVVSIARKNTASNDDYPTYDRDNAIKIYISFTKAKILHDAILKLLNDKSINNVCIEGNRSNALKVSNGIEFGSETPVISIVYLASDNNSTGRTLSEICYQTKTNYEYKYNSDISTGRAESGAIATFELDTLLMVLEQYYYASSYAIAATIREANSYNERFKNDILKSIAEKNGISTKRSGNYSSTSVFDSNGNSIAPKEFQESSFDDIAGSLMDDDFDMTSTLD